MKNIPWYTGQYDHRNYQSYFKVAARETLDGRSAIDNPKKKFPRTGEVEFHGTDILQSRPQEWAAFQVGPDPRNKTQAKHTRRIYPYCDLSPGQSLLEARRQLSSDGVTADGEPGLWAIRFGPDGFILAGLTGSRSDCLMLSRSQSVHGYTFNENGVISVSDTSECGKAFYMSDTGASPARVHDWAPDKQYIENVIQLFSCAGSTTELASWLRVHSDEKSGKLNSGVNGLLATAQSLRSDELAKKLEDEDCLARQLTELLLSDGRIVSLLERQIQRIAEEEQATLRTEQKKALENEFSTKRQQRRDVLDAEMVTFLATQKSEIEHQVAQLRQRGEEKLQVDFTEKQAKIELTLKHEKFRLERETDRLKGVIMDLCAQNEHQRQTLVSLTSEHEALVASLADVKEHSIQAQAELRHINAAITEKVRRMTYSAIPEVRLSPGAKIVSCNEFGGCVRENKLLTSDGKILMMQFLALILVGECPLLYGPETQDSLVIAESLISSSRSIRQIADPTPIPCEDLWVRAGNNMTTPLYQGLLLNEASYPRTIFAVVEHVECSAARFWLPALKDRLHSGDLPRRFLICGTIENEDCEKAEKIKEQHLRLQMGNVVIQNAIALSPLHFSPENHSELDPGAAPLGEIPDKLIIANKMSAGRLNLANTLRAMRTAHEAGPLDDDNKVMLQKQLVDLYADLQNNELYAR